MELKNVKLYRITHIENIPHILQFGITHKNSINGNQNYKDIGDKRLIDTRNRKNVCVDNGDDSEARNTKTISLGEYTPFYFGVRMPMLYVAQHGGNFVEQATPSEEIVYVVCSVMNVISHHHNFYFSDGHATDMLTSFYDHSKIEDLVNIIDWNAIKSPYWGGADNLNLKRKKQAEFLVSGDISSKHIVGFGCYNINVKNKLISLGIIEDIIKIIPKAYY